ncbi:MAG: winged helix-turn-helix domain-containing protein [Acidobacteriota bacterium]
MQIYRFRDCLLNTLERRVIKNGEFIDLTPRTFDVLQMLVERPGEIITKDEILGRVWHGSFVEEGNLPVHISKLRRALGETRSERFIEAVQGSGYRFIAPILIGSSASHNEEITSNSTSHRFYVKGKRFQDRREKAHLIKAIDYFIRSIAAHPQNVHSYVELAECYIILYTLDLIAHRDLLEKIDPLIAFIADVETPLDIAHSALGGMQLYIKWEFASAERSLRHALALNSDCVLARFRLMDILIQSGRVSEASSELHKIMKVESLSLQYHKRVARILWKLGQLGDARTYLEDAFELDPLDHQTPLLLGVVLTDLGKYEQAISLFEKSLSECSSIEAISMIGYAQALSGKAGQAMLQLEKIDLFSTDEFKPAIASARIYAALGDVEGASRFLELAFDNHEIDLLALGFDPRWNPIRSEPRFQELAARIAF